LKEARDENISEVYQTHTDSGGCIFAANGYMASAHEGSVTLDLTYIGAGIGYQSGTATVVLNGKRATFKISGGQFLGGDLKF